MHPQTACLASCLVTAEDFGGKAYLVNFYMAPHTWAHLGWPELQLQEAMC